MPKRIPRNLGGKLRKDVKRHVPGQRLGPTIRITWCRAALERLTGPPPATPQLPPAASARIPPLRDSAGSSSVARSALASPGPAARRGESDAARYRGWLDPSAPETNAAPHLTSQEGTHAWLQDHLRSLVDPNKCAGFEHLRLRFYRGTPGQSHGPGMGERQH